MRYRLRTLLILLVPVGVGLAWWRDHAQLSSRLELRERQVRQLQRQVDERVGGFIIASNIRFKSAAELIEFVSDATDEEFQKEDWSAFSSSYVAEQAIAPLAELLSSPNDEARHHAAWLLGVFGRKRRPPSVDPIPALVKAVDDPSPRVRAETIYAIGQCGQLASAALPKLRAIMQRDQSVDALFATLAVKEVDPSANIGPRLRELFLAGEPGVRENVAFWLPDHLPREEAKQLLMAQYERENNKDMREVLAQAMNKVKD